MNSFPARGIERGDLNRNAARGGNPEEAGCGAEDAEDNDAILVPCARRPRAREIRQSLRRATGRFDLLELVLNG